jgi:hypothetical protein|tara:strand:+ start:186 stop:323 length:138 start_codon:yes stop_codon:yes gene_type:complete
MVVNKKTIQLIIDKAFDGAWILFPERSNPMFMMLGVALNRLRIVG